MCCRDGKGKENTQPRKTEKKRVHSGSRKLQSSCISRMTVTEDTKSGSVHLVFIKTHTNHEPGLNEVKYLPLPNTTRQQVKQRYNDGVGLDKIIDGEIMDSNFYSSFLKIEIRGPIVNRQLRSGFTESATRATFITRQDIRNIVRKIEDSLKHRHQIDAVSVDRLVKELKLEEDNPIIAYKPQVLYSTN